MPGRYEEWGIFLTEAERASLDLIVCLAPSWEMEGGTSAYAQARLRRTLPYDVRDFPIEDFGVPPDERRPVFKAFVTELARELTAGANILIHCRVGIGRTGTVATCLLLELGLPPDEALRRVRHAGSRPQSPEQKALILWYQASS